MENSFLWDADQSRGIGSLDILEKPKTNWKRSSLFDDDDTTPPTQMQAPNYKDLYEKERERSVELERKVRTLNIRVQELEDCLHKAPGAEQDDELERAKEARLQQQINRQKRSARSSKRKVKTGAPQILVADEAPAEEQPAAGGDFEVLNEERVDSVDSSRDGILFDIVGQEVCSTIADSIGSVPDKKANAKKAISLFDSSSGEDSDDFLKRRNDLSGPTNPLSHTIGREAGSVDQDINGGKSEATGEANEVDEEEVRRQEKLRLERQIQRQKQVNRRSQRARAGAASSNRRAVVKSNISTLNVAKNGSTPGAALSSSVLPTSPVQATGQPKPKGPSLWSDDEDDDDDDVAESDDWSSSSEEEEVDGLSATLNPPQTRPIQPEQSERVEEDSGQRVELAVIQWCRGKDLGAMISTLPNISLASGLTLEQLQSLDLSTPPQLRKAYLYVMHEHVIARISSLIKRCVQENSKVLPPRQAKGEQRSE